MGILGPSAPVSLERKERVDPEVVRPSVLSRLPEDESSLHQLAPAVTLDDDEVAQLEVHRDDFPERVALVG